MTIPVMTTGERVRLVMARAGESQSELAEALGLHRATISRLLTTNARWRAADVQAVATRYEVPVGWLMGEQE